jgi:CheY-like chemotaxis protein
MPDLNGIDAAKMLRHFEVSTGRKVSVKIGFITGHSNNKEKQVCESADIGASFYISKPVTLISLQGVLQPNSIMRKISHNKNSGTIADKLSPEINFKRQPVVLCVDDDILNLEIFEALITALGATAIRASSGKEAIKAFSSRVLRSQPLDLVLIDCLMPGVDGWTAAAEMKKLASNIPVIGVTGCDIKSNEVKFKASGMCDMIRKPVQREELAKILKNSLSIS